MSSLGSLAFYAALGLLVLMGLTVVFRTRWAWWVRLGATLVVGWTLLTAQDSVVALMGWPTTDSLPERFRLHAAHVDEPTKGGQVPGRIYLWAVDFLAPSNTPPRAYEIAYSATLHQKLNDASAQLRKNIPQLGEIKPPPPAASTTSSAHASQKILYIDFFDMPDPLGIAE
jgi:hypothetical protein